MKALLFDGRMAISIGLCLVLIPALSDVQYLSFPIGKMFLLVMGLVCMVMGYRQV